MSTSNPAADRLGVALARAHGCAVTLSGYRSLVLAPDVRTSLDGYDAADRATSELLASMAEAITVARSISGDRTSHPQVRRRAAAAVASLEALGKDVMWPGGVGWARRTLAVQVRRTAHVTERLAGVSAVQGGTSATTARPNRCSVW